MNRTQPSLQLGPMKNNTDSALKTFGKRNSLFFYDTIHENRKIEPCGIEDVLQ